MAARKKTTRKKAGRTRAARKKTTRKKTARKTGTRKKAVRKEATRKKAVRKKATRKKAVRKKTTRKKAARKRAKKKPSRIDRITTEQQGIVNGFAHFGEFASKGLAEGNLQVDRWINESFKLWKDVLNRYSRIAHIYSERDGRR
jgi:hypothetical protein